MSKKKQTSVITAICGKKKVKAWYDKKIGCWVDSVSTKHGKEWHEYSTGRCIGPNGEYREGDAEGVAAYVLKMVSQ